MNDTSEHPGNLASLTNGPAGICSICMVALEQKTPYGQSKRMKDKMIHVVIMFTPEGVTTVNNVQGPT